MTMARHACPDDPAVDHVQRREQSGGAVALVVVVHGAGTPFFMGNPGWMRSSAWIWLFSSMHRISADEWLTDWVKLPSPAATGKGPAR